MNVLAENEEIAKIERTTLGFEDHGILTAWLHLSYGGAGQGAGGWALDGQPNGTGHRTPSEECGRWVAGVLRACGVEKWEDVAGKTVIAIKRDGLVRGIRPLPTERGETFMFAEEES